MVGVLRVPSAQKLLLFVILLLFLMFMTKFPLSSVGHLPEDLKGVAISFEELHRFFQYFGPLFLDLPL